MSLTWAETWEDFKDVSVGLGVDFSHIPSAAIKSVLLKLKFARVNTTKNSLLVSLLLPQQCSLNWIPPQGGSKQSCCSTRLGLNFEGFPDSGMCQLEGFVSSGGALSIELC